MWAFWYKTWSGLVLALTQLERWVKCAERLLTSEKVFFYFIRQIAKNRAVLDSKISFDTFFVSSEQFHELEDAYPRIFDNAFVIKTQQEKYKKERQIIPHLPLVMLLQKSVRCLHKRWRWRSFAWISYKPNAAIKRWDKDQLQWLRSQQYSFIQQEHSQQYEQFLLCPMTVWQILKTKSQLLALSNARTLSEWNQWPFEALGFLGSLQFSASKGKP